MAERSRIRLLPRNPQWTETQRDAVRALERSLLRRGFHRKGDIVEVPLTIGHMQKMLSITGARRKGNHYARACIAELVALEIIEDTGRVLTPSKQTSNFNLRWWRVFRILPIARIIRSLTPHAYGYRREVFDLQASLLSFVRCQLARKKDFRPSAGSVQEAFHEMGPP